MSDEKEPPPLELTPPAGEDAKKPKKKPGKRGRPRKHPPQGSKTGDSAYRMRLSRERRRAQIDADAELLKDKEAAEARADELKKVVDDRLAARIAARDANRRARIAALSDEFRSIAEDSGFLHVAEGLQYVRDVQSGKIPACERILQALTRHDRDVERIGSPDWPYVFDAARAEKVIKAMEKFREIKGPRAGKTLQLQPWQKFGLLSVFGWIHRDTGTRRFRYALWFIPKGNGKTTLAAPLGLYMLALDREGGAEVYAAAVTRDQARLVFKTAQEMVRRDAGFRLEKGVSVEAHSIVQSSTASEFRPLSRDAQSLDGLNVHCAIVDELAAHRHREVHDVLITAMGKRSQALMFVITTAGNSIASVGYEQVRYAERVLAGEVVDEQFFALLYGVDEGDDWLSPQTWQKANPNWNVSVMPDMVESLARRAMHIPSQQNAFKTRHLNIWTNAAVSWMNESSWNACAGLIDQQTLKDAQCVVGLDLAAKIDLAAKVLLFRRQIDGVDHYYVLPKFYLPAAVVQSLRHPAYAGWAAQGYLTICPGETTDFNLIEADVAADCERFNVIDIGYDPYQAKMLAGNLERSGFPVIEVRPTLANFSPAMKELDALVREGRLHHPGHPVLDWNVFSVEVYEYSNGNVYPRKDKNDAFAKIDGAVALLMALARFMVLDAEAPGEGASLMFM